ncbi:MAG: MFS transporter [Chloroflexi bacterium]|nr:MFS transporter [Chloroflexota bacterium]
MTTGKPEKARIFYGYVIVGAAFFIFAFILGSNNAYGVFFTPIEAEFGWTRATTSWAFSLRLIFYAIASMGVVGRLSDRVEPKFLLLSAGIFTGLSFILMAYSYALWQLYVFFGAIAGIGISGAIVPVLSTVARWFSKRRGIMTGTVSMGIGIGTSFVPLLANWLFTLYGWRTAFLIVGGLTIAVVAGFAQLIRRDPHSMGLYPDGARQPVASAVASASRGLTVREAMRTRQLWLFLTAFAGMGYAMFVPLVHIVVHAIGLGVPQSAAVSIIAIIGFVNILGRLVMGLATDRIGSARALSIALVVMVVALAWLQFARELWTLYLFGAMFGFAWAGSFMQESPIVAELFGLKSHGKLLALADAFLTIGGVLGPVIAGYIFDRTGSYQVGFLLAGGVSVVSLVLSLILVKSGSAMGVDNGTRRSP